MLEYTFLGEFLNWKIILVNILCIGICFEYIVHKLKRIKLHFEQGLPLQEGEMELNETIRISIFLISLACTSPMVNSILAIFTMILFIGAMVYLYKKDEAKQYGDEIKSWVKKILIAMGIVFFIAILRINCNF